MGKSMEKPLKIAICGKIRSGKDTVADYLADKHGAQKFRFGDGIRAVSRILYPEQMAAGKPREILQGVGQAVRTFDPNIWVDYCFREIKKAAADRVIISDLRQPNEYKVLREAGFFIIGVSAPEADRLARAKARGDQFDPRSFYHETESHVDGFRVDFHILNYGTLSELLAQADKAAAEVLK